MNIRKIIREEADGLDWVKNVSSDPQPWEHRAKVKFSVLFDSYFKDDLEDDYVIDMLDSFEDEGYINVTNRNEESEIKEWTWVEEPDLWNWENRETLDYLNNDEWEHHHHEVVDYELEYGQTNEIAIFKRKSDGRFFGYRYTYGYHSGIEDVDSELTEVFPKKVTVTQWV